MEYAEKIGNIFIGYLEIVLLKAQFRDIMIDTMTNR